MTRNEYARKEKELTRAAACAEAEAARRIRSVTRELVMPLVNEFCTAGMIPFPTEELARRIDHIIREEGAKPVRAARNLQTEMEASLRERLGISIPVGLGPPHKRQLNERGKPPGEILTMKGGGWGYGTTSGYYRDPDTGNVVWTDLPLEYRFRKRKDLSTRVWKAVEDQESKILDVIRGGRAAGRNVRDIAKDLEAYINYPNGGERVAGRWRAMFPDTEKGRREALQREYLVTHGGLQYGTLDAKALLREEDAKAFVSHRMATVFGPPPVPDAVNQYMGRLGKAGLDYRAIRIARTETAAMLADEQLEIAGNSAICTGEMEFVMDRGRDHGNCTCEEYAAGSPWHIDDPARPDIPVHPNCMCEWRPLLKSDQQMRDEFNKELAELEKRAREEADTGSAIHGVPRDDGPQDSMDAAPEKDGIHTINEFPRGEPMPIKEASEGVNPNFDKDNGYGENCQRCTPVYDLRRRGYDLAALPRIASHIEDAIKDGTECYEHPLIFGYPNKGYLTKNELLNELNKLPNNARATVYINQSGKNGHSIICEKTEDGLVFIDPQNPKRNAELLIHLYDQFGFFRMDTLSIKNDFDLTQIVQSTDTKTSNSRRYNRGNGEANMTRLEAEEIFRKNWWKHFNTPDHENCEIIIKEVVEERPNSTVFLAAVMEKGKGPDQRHFFCPWQVDADGNCVPIINIS